MSAPSGLVTVCDLNVEGSAGCAAAAYANTTMPSAAVMRSRLIVVSPDLNRSGSQQKCFCERATGCTNTVSLRGVAHIVSLGLLNSITIQLRMSPRRGTTQPVKLILDSAQARHGAGERIRSSGKNSAWRNSWRPSRLGGERVVPHSPPRRQGDPRAAPYNTA